MLMQVALPDYLRGDFDRLFGHGVLDDSGHNPAQGDARPSENAPAADYGVQTVPDTPPGSPSHALDDAVAYGSPMACSPAAGTLTHPGTSMRSPEAVARGPEQAVTPNLHQAGSPMVISPMLSSPSAGKGDLSQGLPGPRIELDFIDTTCEEPTSAKCPAPKALAAVAAAITRLQGPTDNVQADSTSAHHLGAVQTVRAAARGLFVTGCQNGSAEPAAQVDRVAELAMCSEALAGGETPSPIGTGTEGPTRQQAALTPSRQVPLRPVFRSRVARMQLITPEFQKAENAPASPCSSGDQMSSSLYIRVEQHPPWDIP